MRAVDHRNKSFIDKIFDNLSTYFALMMILSLVVSVGVLVGLIFLGVAAYNWLVTNSAGTPEVDDAFRLLMALLS